MGGFSGTVESRVQPPASFASGKWGRGGGVGSGGCSRTRARVENRRTWTLGAAHRRELPVLKGALLSGVLALRRRRSRAAVAHRKVGDGQSVEREARYGV